MKLSLAWIKNYVRVPDVSAKELANAITMATVEVESIIDQAAELSGVYVGTITEVIRHPKADRLWVCRVDTKRAQHQVICGGTNVKNSMTVAFAEVGSKVKWHGKGEPIVLSKVKIRGVESDGMIAAASEIGLDRLFPQKSEHEILDLSAYDLKVGEPLAKALGFSDTIFVIDNKSMTHRPDLWGQYGLAREIAAIYNVTLKPMASPSIPSVSGRALKLSVEVADHALCPVYSAIVIDNVTPRESPWWLKRDLEALGIASLNSIVDITNYVMVSLGQPMHAFDYTAIADSKIVVDVAGKQRAVNALDGKTYTVTGKTLMVRDGKKDLAIAGIIGGMSSCITDRTKTIVYEAANFSGSSVRLSSLAMGLRTDASSRFEKRLDPHLVPQAMAMAVDLTLKLHPQARIASPAYEVRESLPNAPVVVLNKDLLDKRFGHVLTMKEIVSVLKRLEFKVSTKKMSLTITVPSFRAQHITIPEDIVEEVARIYGYNKVEPVMPRVTIVGPERSIPSQVEREVKQLLAYGLGYSEVYNYSFEHPLWADRLGLTKDHVAVRNYLNADQKYLRTSLLPQLCGNIVSNVRWYDEFKLFEVGRVFINKPGTEPADQSGASFLPKQPRMFAGVFVSKQKKAHEVYGAVKGVLEQIGKHFGIAMTVREAHTVRFAHVCYELRVHDKTVGYFGLIREELMRDEVKHAVVGWWEIDFLLFAKFVSFSKTYKPLPRYPSVVRDCSIIVDSSVLWKQIEDASYGVSPLLKSIELFDVFTSLQFGTNKKSIAFRLTFASDERTLESSEVDKILKKITGKLTDVLGARIR